jgi:spermidine synthase
VRLRAVFLTVFVIAACGLGYELVAATTASHVLGDTVTQYSISIGLYLFAMGGGAWLSRFFDRRIADRFVDIELCIALVGGTLALVATLAAPMGGLFRPLIYGETLVVGVLVGLEIPLLLRILKDEMAFKDLVGLVLTFDYVGALVLSLLFGLVLVPELGLLRTSLLLGLLNALTALWSTWVFESRLARPRRLRVRAVAVVLVLTAGIAVSDRVTGGALAQIYGEPVLLSRRTPYQSIDVTEGDRGFHLWLNYALQFSSVDEYRYHEALVHPVLAAVPDARRVLVLGGGDGLAVREVLKHRGVERVTLVDIDPGMTSLATTDWQRLVDLNGGSLKDPRVRVVNDDAMRWLGDAPGLHDVAIVDFPDPASYAVGKLYTTRFYERLASALTPDAAIVVQASSPFLTRRAFWCTAATLEAAGFFVRPYRGWVPSFQGDWGFLLAMRRTFEAPAEPIAGLRSLDGPSLRAMFVLPPDCARVPVEVNRLDTQVLVRYYEADRPRNE